MLSLQAQAVTMLIYHAIFSDVRAIQKISGIKLDTGFGGMNVHQPSAHRFVEGCCENRLAGGIRAAVRISTIHDPAMVITASELKLLFFVVDPAANRRRCSKIKWCSRNVF